MASAILTLLDPRRYGVIDIRVWQLLYKLGVVRQKPSGTGFNFNNWYRFLMIVRHFSRKLRVNARDIERTLFVVHREYQEGRLYGKPSKWVKKSSPRLEVGDKHLEYHWYEHPGIGRVEMKRKEVSRR